VASDNKRIAHKLAASVIQGNRKWDRRRTDN